MYRLSTITSMFPPPPITSVHRPLIPYWLHAPSPRDTTPSTYSVPLVLRPGPPLSPEQGPELGWLETPIYDRAALSAGTEIVGPAIIEQLDATTLVHPGDTARVDDALNILITVAA